MLQLDRSIAIRRPAEDVWPHLATLAEELRWRAPYVVALSADGDPLQPGTRISGTTRFLGQTDTYDNEVTEVAPPRRLAWRGIAASGSLIGAEGAYELEPRGDSTVFRLWLTYRPTGTAGRWQEPVMGVLLRRIGDRFARQLKELAEGDGVRGPAPDGNRLDRLRRMRRRFVQRLTVMPPVVAERESSVPPERVIEAAHDFSPRRADYFPNVHLDHITVHCVGESTADVTEGNPWPLGIMWERMTYDWSQPGLVKGTVTDSNIFHAGSTWELRAVSSGTGSRVQVRGVRHLKGRGLLLAPLFPLGVAKRSVAEAQLRQLLTTLEAEAGN